MKNHLDAWWYIYSNISILKTFVYFVYTETKKIVYGCSTFIQFSSRSNHIFRYILYYDFVNSCAEGVFQKQNPKIRYDFLDPFAFFHHRDPFKKNPM